MGILTFKTEAERLQHPIAGQIPSKVWESAFDSTLTDQDQGWISSSWNDLVAGDYSALKPPVRKRLLFVMRLFHPTMPVEQWYQFATQKLELPLDKLILFGAELGHLDFFRYLNETVPNQFPDLMATKDFHAFCVAARFGQLDILRYLLDQAPHRLSEMVAARDYAAFRWAAENNQLDVLRYLGEKAPNLLPEMMAAEKCYAFQQAARYGFLDVLRYFEEKAPGRLLEMLEMNDYGDFAWAALNGHLDVLHYFEDQAPRLLLKMIAAKEYQAFRNAAQGGRLDILRYLEEKAPHLLFKMIEAKDCAAFRLAAERGHLDVLRYLEEKVPHGLFLEMIVAKAFNAFYGAAHLGHLDLLRYLEEKAYNLLPEMMAADNFAALRVAILCEQHHIVQHLLTFAYSYGYAEAHYQENNYGVPVTASTVAFLDSLRERQAAFGENGVFDFQSNDPRDSQQQALYGYYVLRHLIRQLSNNQYGEAVYDHIQQLLMIPSIRMIVIRNTRNINPTTLDAGSALGNITFAQQSNELLRLAMSVDNPVVIQQLLSIPECMAAAQRNHFYANESALNLGEMAADRESSMVGLTPQEQKQLGRVESAYKSTVKETPGGIPGVVDALRLDLKTRFLSEEHKAERLVTFRGQTVELPFSYEEFQALIQAKKTNKDELQSWNEVYYRNIFHTAWRYLSKPNKWMDPQAPYVTRNANREGWSTFTEYLPLIAYLYCAARDESRPPFEPGMSMQDRVELFMRALSLINRQHNWDKSRPVYDKDGKPIPNQIEQYDDMRGDRPSCFSGVKRNLFQALISHPLYQALTELMVVIFIKENIREHYTKILTSKTAEELTAIKDAVEDYIFESTRSEILDKLNWEDIAGIEEKLQAKFLDQAKEFFPNIPLVLYSQRNSEDTKRPYVLVNYYQGCGLDKLIDTLIAQKTRSATLDPKIQTLISRLSAFLEKNTRSDYFRMFRSTEPAGLDVEYEVANTLKSELEQGVDQDPRILIQRVFAPEHITKLRSSFGQIPSAENRELNSIIEDAGELGISSSSTPSSLPG